jgi:antitoxin HigA-1
MLNCWITLITTDLAPSEHHMNMHNPAHPGELLQGWLADLELGVAQTAAHLGIGRVTLSRILHGHAGISADVDLRLSEAFGTSPGYWLRMQAARDAWEAKAQAKARPKIKRLPGLASVAA